MKATRLIYCGHQAFYSETCLNDHLHTAAASLLRPLVAGPERDAIVLYACVLANVTTPNIKRARARLKRTIVHQPFYKYHTKTAAENPSWKSLCTSRRARSLLAVRLPQHNACLVVHTWSLSTSGRWSR